MGCRGSRYSPKRDRCYCVYGLGRGIEKEEQAEGVLLEWLPACVRRMCERFESVS